MHRLASSVTIPTHEQASCDLLVFRLGTERYALPTSKVREIARPTRITPVPGTPAELPGIVSHHGTLLPVVDARPLLGLAFEPATRTSRLIALQCGDIELALVADEVFDLIALPLSAFEALPSGLDLARAQLLAGIAVLDEQPLALLDLNALITMVCNGA